jgi:type I restriction enzyme S subunit
MWQYYFLTALNLNKLATATAQPGLAVSNVIESLIPLPPLAEQKRIVAKIEQVLGEIDKLKR